MQGAARVDFSPLAVASLETGEGLIVYGGRLRAFALGSAPSTAPGPVDLIFSADYLTTARRGEVSSVGEFAKLPAELVPTDEGLELRIAATGNSLPLEELVDIADQVHPVAGSLPPLSLVLELGTGFRVGDREPNDTSDSGSGGDASSRRAGSSSTALRARLRVPPPTRPSGFLEISVSIKRLTTELTPASVNGRLDVPLRALGYLVLHVENADGDPAAAAAVEVVTRGGDLVAGKTDGNGRFAINGIPKGDCRVQLPEHTRLRARPRIPSRNQL